jgi:hypothetical protein
MGRSGQSKQENAIIWSFCSLRGVAAAAALVATISVAATPAHAALTHNALTAAGASAIDDLNGVVVEACVPRDNPDLDWVGPGMDG